MEQTRTWGLTIAFDNSISHLSMRRTLFYGAKSPKGDVSPNIGSSFSPSFYEWQVWTVSDDSELAGRKTRKCNSSQRIFLLLKQRFRSESLKRIYSRWSQSRFKRERPQHDFIYRHNTAIPFELLIRCSRAFPAFALVVPQNQPRLHHTVAAVSRWITGLLQLFHTRSCSCHFQSPNKLA